MLVILKDSQRFELSVILDSIIAFYVGSCKFDYSLLKVLIFIFMLEFGEERNMLLTSLSNN